jgi:PKD repeat protein
VVEAYAPTAYFWCDPVDPSTYDTIQFSNAVNDQFDVGVAAWFWDFGDGTSDTAQFPSHRFTQDGDYTVSLTITATDGRTTTSSQVVSVSTHNIAVVAFHAPRTAQVGKAKTFTIRVRNAVQPELATVALWRSVPGGWAWVASTTQEIPVSRGGSTSTYTFSYTFTQEDLSTGSVAFKAAVSLEGARDAIPGDNELTSPPTRILK